MEYSKKSLEKKLSEYNLSELRNMFNTSSLLFDRQLRNEESSSRIMTFNLLSSVSIIAEISNRVQPRDETNLIEKLANQLRDNRLFGNRQGCLMMVNHYYDQWVRVMRALSFFTMDDFTEGTLHLSCIQDMLLWIFQFKDEHIA